MMQATLAAQAAIIAFAFLLSEPASIARQSQRAPQLMDEHRVLYRASTKLRCRLYFGCVHE